MLSRLTRLPDLWLIEPMTARHTVVRWPARAVLSVNLGERRCPLPDPKPSPAPYLAMSLKCHDRTSSLPEAFPVHRSGALARRCVLSLARLWERAALVSTHAR
jgi:hypothetical protein